MRTFLRGGTTAIFNGSKKECFAVLLNELQSIPGTANHMNYVLFVKGCMGQDDKINANENKNRSISYFYELLAKAFSIKMLKKNRHPHNTTTTLCTLTRNASTAKMAVPISSIFLPFCAGIHAHGWPPTS